MPGGPDGESEEGRGGVMDGKRRGVDARLDPTIRRAARWVSALENGEYGLSRGTMHDGTGYDAFGVACVAVFRNRFRKRGGVYVDARGCHAVLDYRRLADLGLHEVATEPDVRRMRRCLERILADPEREDLYQRREKPSVGDPRWLLVLRLVDAGATHPDMGRFLRGSGWYSGLERTLVALGVGKEVGAVS